MVCPEIVSRTFSPRHKHWPAGPEHFSDRRASTFYLSLARTGHLSMSGHQISNSAGPKDDKSQYVLFARAPVPHPGSFRAVLLLRQRVTSRSRACQSNTLKSVFRSRRMRYFNANIRTHPGTFLRGAHGMDHGSE